jgi:hypothetical protein
LRDETQHPPLTLLPETLELELENLWLREGESASATLRLDFAQVGLVDRLHLAAEFTPRLHGLAPDEAGVVFDLDLAGKLTVEGLSSQLATAYLERAGIEGQLDGAGLEVGLSASLTLGPEGQFDGEFGLEELGFGTPGPQLGLKKVRLPLSSDRRGLRLGPVEVEGLRAQVSRDEAGRFGFAGLVFAGAAEDNAASPAASMAPPAAAAPRAPVAFLGLDVLNSGLRIDDRFVPGGATPEVGFEVHLGALSPGLDAPFRLRLTAPDLVDEVVLEGRVRPDVASVRFDGRLDASGVRGAGLNAWLPEGVALELQDGSAGLAFEGFVQTVDALRDPERPVLYFELKDAVARDGHQEHFRLGRLVLDVAELSHEAIEVSELVLGGLELAARRDPSGAMHVAGVVLAPAPSGEGAPEPPASSDSGGGLGAPEEPARPRLGLGHLSLELLHFGFLDETEPGAVPLDVALVLENTAPWSLDTADEETPTAPLELRLSGHALPVAQSLALDVGFDFFRAEPHLDLELELSGLSGTGLAAALPALEESLDASAMEGGRFAAKLRADLAVTRRGPFAVDLSRGLSGELEVSELGFARTPDGPVELGFGSLLVELSSVSSAGLEIGQLELTDPVGRIAIVPDGLAVAGLVLKSPAEVAPAEAVAAAETSEPMADGTPVASAFPVTIKDVYLSGLDFVFRDTTTDPPVELPLTDLDLSVKGVSTRALEEPLPISFELFVGAGHVELARRAEAANIFTGFLGAAASVVTGGEDEFKTELRPVFGGLDASGRVTLFPAPKGWATLSLAGLELPVFRGGARQGGVDLGDGLVDLDLDVRLLGERGAAVSMRLSAASLSLSEPPGGPISTYLKLPAPLDTVLFLLRNEDGDVVLPLDLAVAPDGGIDGLGTEIAKTIGLVVGEAIASSPLRIVGGVLDMTGLTDDEPVVLPEEPASLAFLEAGVELSQDLETVLAETFDLLRRDPELKVDLVHVFGEGDLVELAERANPGADVCRALAARLGTERDLLFAKREERATDLRARFAAGDASGIERGRGELLELDGELAALEDALDSVLGLLRPGAERRAARRTKVAALLVAEERLERVRTAIEAQPIVSIGARLRVRRPRFETPVPGPGRVLVVPR